MQQMGRQTDAKEMKCYFSVHKTVVSIVERKELRKRETTCRTCISLAFLSYTRSSGSRIKLELKKPIPTCMAAAALTVSLSYSHQKETLQKKKHFNISAGC